MGYLFDLFLLEGFASSIDFVNPETTSFVIENAWLILVGLVLIIITVFIIFFLKKIIVNSITGIVFWAIIVFIFNINLPFFPSLIISIIIGPAGVGTMLLLNAFGLLLI